MDVGKKGVVGDLIGGGGMMRRGLWGGWFGGGDRGMKKGLSIGERRGKLGKGEGCKGGNGEM